LKNRKRPQGHEIVKGGVELVICKRSQIWLFFIGIWLRKIKRKIQWDFDPKVYFENGLSEVCSSFFENDFSKCKA
jgi:hypothetical protein